MARLPKKIEDVKQVVFLLNLTTGKYSKFLACDQNVIPYPIEQGSFIRNELFYSTADAPGETYRYNSQGIAYDPRKPPPGNIPTKNYPWITTIGKHTFNIRVVFAEHLYTHPFGKVVAKHYSAYLTREFIPGAIPDHRWGEWLENLKPMLKKIKQGKYHPLAIGASPGQNGILEEPYRLAAEITETHISEPEPKILRRSSVGKRLKLAWLPGEVIRSDSFQRLKIGERELFRILYTFCKRAGGGSRYSYNQTGIFQLAKLLALRKKDMLASSNPATRKDAEKIGTSKYSITRYLRNLKKSGWVKVVLRGYPGVPDSPGKPRVNKFLVVKSEKQRRFLLIPKEKREH